VEAEGSIPSTPTQDFKHLDETWASVKPVRDEFRDEFSTRVRSLLRSAPCDVYYVRAVFRLAITTASRAKATAAYIFRRPKPRTADHDLQKLPLTLSTTAATSIVRSRRSNEQSMAAVVTDLLKMRSGGLPISTSINRALNAADPRDFPAEALQNGPLRKTNCLRRPSLSADRPRRRKCGSGGPFRSSPATMLVSNAMTSRSNNRWHDALAAPRSHRCVPLVPVHLVTCDLGTPFRIPANSCWPAGSHCSTSPVRVQINVIWPPSLK
jgi:hypothetical protein